MKKCTKCGELKRGEEFSKNVRATDGTLTWCKACFTEYRRNRKLTHPDAKLAAVFKHRYGITLEQRMLLWSQQEGKCRICGRFEEGLVVDHNHETGHIRGLLCRDCNWLLGLARDMPEVLRRAADYLVESAANPKIIPISRKAKKAA